jgi:hypothetical protein
VIAVGTAAALTGVAVAGEGMPWNSDDAPAGSSVRQTKAFDEVGGATRTDLSVFQEPASDDIDQQRKDIFAFNLKVLPLAAGDHLLPLKYMRTMFEDEGVEILGLPTERGAVCYFTFIEHGGGSVCVSDLSRESPLKGGWGSSSTGATADGVIIDGVEEVLVVLDDGRKERARIGHNAFFWSGPKDDSVAAFEARMEDGSTVHVNAR